MNNFQEKVGFIWSVADLLRGDCDQAGHGIRTVGRWLRVVFP